MCVVSLPRIKRDLVGSPIVKQGEMLGLIGQTGAAKEFTSILRSARRVRPEHSHWVNPNDFVTHSVNPQCGFVLIKPFLWEFPAGAS